MTGQDMRCFARESAEFAETVEGGTPTPTDHLWVATDKIKALTSALCEAEARLSRVLDAFDPRDPSLPQAVADMAMLHMGLRPAATAFCQGHLEYTASCRACAAAVYMRNAARST